jgi:hypothetical protein
VVDHSDWMKESDTSVVIIAVGGAGFVCLFCCVIDYHATVTTSKANKKPNGEELSHRDHSITTVFLLSSIQNYSHDTSDVHRLTVNPVLILKANCCERSSFVS